ncbi:F0F1 ATP synthase subunit epsilon [Candidatus Uabimicrobium amorphum]|uniref:ATP synthase epsilon chain n=1 Tax=Uabimicrobium amorphum TaxID=2596890 RepID=A0A5S9F4R5_UABAM|nr:F0F1 ATP synthase subunit epsilon [Candidatus Uabimicrobium amorphum]BBM85832.1 F0F1 ATP synthase subunit epsilon [Candidatus Uabimicrobium amorphum]
MQNSKLFLKVLLPTKVILQCEAIKIIAEGKNGSFCLLPQHIDFVSALVPGILAVTDVDGKEQFVAVDEGILVKCSGNVFISTVNAVISNSLEELNTIIRENFQHLNEKEKSVRSAVAKLEAGFIKTFINLKEHG